MLYTYGDVYIILLNYSPSGSYPVVLPYTHLFNIYFLTLFIQSYYFNVYLILYNPVSHGYTYISNFILVGEWVHTITRTCLISISYICSMSS